MHVYLSFGAEVSKQAAIASYKISPNTEFSFGHVPENSFAGLLEYKFGSRPALQFQKYGCSFSGQIQFGKLIRAEVGPTFVDHTFIVTTEPDAQLALKAANGG